MSLNPESSPHVPNVELFLAQAKSKRRLSDKTEVSRYSRLNQEYASRTLTAINTLLTFVEGSEPQSANKVMSIQDVPAGYTLNLRSLVHDTGEDHRATIVHEYLQINNDSDKPRELDVWWALEPHVHYGMAAHLLFNGSIFPLVIPDQSAKLAFHSPDQTLVNLTMLDPYTGLLLVDPNTGTITRRMPFWNPSIPARAATVGLDIF